MAVIKKTLFAENLDRYQTFVTDSNPNSDYFKITELSDTFTGGKNAFLIQGSDYLVPDTLIKIEIKDSKGNIIYHEPGEGIVSSSVDGAEVVTEYYEGVSKVVAVHVYPDTAYGPATITILGELSSYNSNGLNSPIPLEWEGKYNVKWQKQINVNPSLANTTKIRFYRRPTATIVETLSPIYTIVSGSKVESNIVSSFANVTLSNLDTFAGDVKRIKVYRTSEGDISDYDMIQDILLESKELLTSYELTGSVIGEAGLMTSEVLQKLWSYPTLTTQLTSSRIDNGVKLNGNGYFRYTSSLQLSANSVYEFGIDAFYSASTNSDMGVYVSGSKNGEVLVGTLNGVTPTKNLKDTVLQFTLPLDEPTASLYLSQSQSEWHIGNLSLKLTQDTAFSPSEIAFVTSMPTVVGNETYNFKFEFYDVNNNYVPVLVTKSALFTGGNNNIGGTLIFISASASSSLGQLYAVSSSISGTATLYSSSANTTIVTLSGSVSGSITTVSGSVVTLSGSVSGSITNLSSSVSASITSLSSSVSSSNAVILSSSFAQVKNLADGRYSGSFIGDTVIYSPTIGGQQGYISDLFKVGTSPSIYLDARQNPRKIFIGGVTDSGSYNNSNTSVYMDSTGKFSLKDKLTWDGNSTLTVTGQINIVAGGNAATQTFANTIGTNAVTSGSNAAANAVASGSASAQAAQTAAELFATSAAGRAVTSGSAAASAAQQAAINQAKTDASASVNLLANGDWTGGSGTFITSNSISSPLIAGNGGYISGLFKVGNAGITLDGVNKKMYIGTGTYSNANTSFYVDNDGNFSLKDKLTWNGSALTVNGTINATAGNFSGNITSTATISGGTISGGTLTGGSINIGSGKFTVSETGVMSCTGASISGIITATQGNIGGWQINPDGLQFTSLDGNKSVKFNSNRGAMELGFSGSVVVDINSNQFLTDLSAGTNVSSGYSLFIPSGTLSGNGTPKYGDAHGTGFALVAGQVYQFLHNSGYMYPVNVYSSDYNSITYGVLISTSSTPTLENSNIQIVGSRYRYGSGQLQPLQVTGNFTATASGTYYIRPFITLYSYESQGGFDGGGYIEYSYTPVNGSLSGDLYFYGPSISRSTQKTEIVGGGIQVVKDIDTYFKVDRNAGDYDAFVKSSGANVTFEGINTGIQNQFLVDKFSVINLNAGDTQMNIGGGSYMGIYPRKGIRISPGAVGAESGEGYIQLEPGTGAYAFVGNSNNVASYRILTGSGGPSDIRLKTEIEELSESSLEKINELKVKSFKFRENGREGDAHGEKKIGVIAQEVLNTSISYVVNQNWPEIDGDYNVDHFSILGHAIKAIQELSAKVEELEAKISGSI